MHRWKVGFFQFDTFVTSAVTLGSWLWKRNRLKSKIEADLLFILVRFAIPEIDGTLQAFVESAARTPSNLLANSRVV